MATGVVVGALLVLALFWALDRRWSRV